MKFFQTLSDRAIQWQQPNQQYPTGIFDLFLFFGERFNFIAAVDGGHQKQVAASVGADGSSLATDADLKASKNGYACVYVSNQSNQDVFFDNFKVQVDAGNILEENHYYSYGLKIAAISSRKMANAYQLGVLKNNYLYQGAYSEMDDDIGWNDFALRNYDPQIGRWVQQDPYQEFASPYLGMGCDPINLIDPSGGNILSGLSTFGRVGVTTLLGAIIGGAIDGMGDDDGDFTGAGIGATVGLIAGLTGNISVTSMIVKGANVATTVINTQFNAKQAGLLSPQTSSQTGTPLSGQQEKQLKNALEFTEGLLKAKQKALNRWDKNDQTEFKTHFGLNNKTSRDMIKKRIDAELKLVKFYLKNDNFKTRFSNSGKANWASVNPKDKKHKVNIGTLFWSSNMLGEDSQHGTLIHEMSHFVDIGGTTDRNSSGHKVYGVLGVKKLILTDPKQALKHADAFEYYIENAF